MNQNKRYSIYDSQDTSVETDEETYESQNYAHFDNVKFINGIHKKRSDIVSSLKMESICYTNVPDIQDLEHSKQENCETENLINAIKNIKISDLDPTIFKILGKSKFEIFHENLIFNINKKNRFKQIDHILNVENTSKDTQRYDLLTLSYNTTKTLNLKYIIKSLNLFNIPLEDFKLYAFIKCNKKFNSLINMYRIFKYYLTFINITKDEKLLSKAKKLFTIIEKFFSSLNENMLTLEILLRIMDSLCFKDIFEMFFDFIKNLIHHINKHVKFDLRGCKSLKKTWSTTNKALLSLYSIEMIKVLKFEIVLDHLSLWEDVNSFIKHYDSTRKNLNFYPFLDILYKNFEKQVNKMVESVHDSLTIKCVIKLVLHQINHLQMFIKYQISKVSHHNYMEKYDKMFRLLNDSERYCNHVCLNEMDNILNTNNIPTLRKLRLIESEEKFIQMYNKPKEIKIKKNSNSDNYETLPSINSHVTIQNERYLPSIQNTLQFDAFKPNYTITDYENRPINAIVNINPPLSKSLCFIMSVFFTSLGIFDIIVSKYSMFFPQMIAGLMFIIMGINSAIFNYEHYLKSNKYKIILYIIYIFLTIIIILFGIFYYMCKFCLLYQIYLPFNVYVQINSLFLDNYGFKENFDYTYEITSCVANCTLLICTLGILLSLDKCVKILKKQIFSFRTIEISLLLTFVYTFPVIAVDYSTSRHMFLFSLIANILQLPSYVVLTMHKHKKSLFWNILFGILLALCIILHIVNIETIVKKNIYDIKYLDGRELPNLNIKILYGVRLFIIF